jgi:SPP1 gp7 family putative phage head morphogenesis protein
MASTIAHAAVTGNVTFADQPTAVQALKDFYTEAGKVGADAASSQLQASPLENLPSVQTLLDKAGITIKNITDTQMNQISTAVRDGVLNGSSASTIADSINETLLDSARAQVIAVTEGNRAYNAATTDSYAAAGLTEFWWVAYDDACPECTELQDGSPYPLDDETPPDHPNCRCYQTSTAP